MTIVGRQTNVRSGVRRPDPDPALVRPSSAGVGPSGRLAGLGALAGVILVVPAPALPSPPPSAQRIVTGGHRRAITATSGSGLTCEGKWRSRGSSDRS
jgi:hypothetical protein